MPRLIDADLRRRDLADAVWRVVRRSGLEGASVRAVAAEGGLSMGSLRHYFGSQSELHLFAMRLVMHDISSRVAALALSGNPRTAAEQVLAEFLPLDDQRRAESEVWLAFTGRALVDPGLRALRDEAYDLLHAACRRLVSAIVPADAARRRRQVDLETERLYALLDGLLLHGVVRPDRAKPTLLRRILAHHLDALATTGR